MPIDTIFAASSAGGGGKQVLKKTGIHFHIIIGKPKILK